MATSSRPEPPENRPEPCPTDEQLAALSRGDLKPDDEATLIAHLDHCPRCCTRLEALDGPMPSRAALGRWSSIEMAPPALAALLSRWRRESPETMEVTGKEELAGPAPGDRAKRHEARSKMETDYVLHMLRTNGPPTDRQYLCRLDRYDVMEVVGQGGMAIVLKARDASLQRVVAIKVLRPHMAADGLARKRFVREGQAVAAVRDPHVIGVYAVEEDAPLPYLVMEYVAGSSLQDRLDKHGPPTLAETLRIGLQMAAGLAAAHAQGLIHRDVKPANVLLENNSERVKISDFGLARQTNATALTESGVVAGTPAYMSPEQVHGAALDPRSDLFSLGSVLYTLCTGKAPFVGSTLLSTMRKVAEDAAPPVRNLNASTPPWLADVIRKLHQKSPDDRYQSAAEVEAVLSQGLAYLQQPSGAPEPHRLYPGEAEEVAEAKPAPAASASEPGWGPWGVLVALALALFIILEGLGATRLLAPRTPAQPGPLAQQDQTSPRDEPHSATIAPSDRAPASTSEPAPQREGTIGVEPAETTIQAMIGGVLIGHTGASAAVQFSPDGTQIASCGGGRGGDRTIYIWDAEKPEIDNDRSRSVNVLKRPYTPTPPTMGARQFDAARQVWAIAWLDDSQTLLAAGVFNEVIEIDASNRNESPKIVNWVEMPIGATYALAAIPNTRDFFAAGADGTIRRYNLDSGRQVSEWWAFPPPPVKLDRPAAINRLSLSPDGSRLVSASQDMLVRVWDTGSGRVVWEASYYGAKLQDVKFADNERLIVAGEALRLYNARDGKVLWTSKPVETVDMAVDAAHRLIATTTAQGGVQLWSLANGADLYALPGALQRQSIAFSPDGRTIVSGGRKPWLDDEHPDYRVLRWRVLRGTGGRSPAGTPDVHSPYQGRPPQNTSFSSPNASVAATTGDKPAVDRARVRPAPLAPPRPNAGVSAPPTNEQPGDAPAPPAYSVVAQPLAELRGHTGSVGDAVFSPDGRVLATASGAQQGDQSVRLWDTSSEPPAAPRTLDLTTLDLTPKSDDGAAPSEPRQAYTLAFTPAGRLLVGGSFGAVLEIDASLETEQPTLLRKFAVTAGATYALAVAPNGEAFYCGGERGLIERYQLSDGALIRSWPSVSQTGAEQAFPVVVRRLAVSPSGRWIASAADDRSVRLWNTATGELRWETPAQASAVSCLAFAGEERLVVGGDELSLLATDTGKPEWTAGRALASDVAVDLARRLLITCSPSSRLTFWNLETGERLLNQTCDERRECVALSPDGSLLVAGGGSDQRPGPERRLLRWRLRRAGESAPQAEPQPEAAAPAEPAAAPVEPAGAAPANEAPPAPAAPASEASPESATASYSRRINACRV